MIVNFHNLSENTDNMLYVVIVSRHNGKWIFVRQKNKTTWEIPGGHIEKGEHPDAAARRELTEETGAVSFDLHPICDFLVSDENKLIDSRKSRLYFAEVLGLEEFEIEEIVLRDRMPKNMTYKGIQPMLFEKVLEEIEKK